MSNQDPYGQGGDWQQPTQQPGQPQQWQQPGPPGGPMTHQPPPPQGSAGANLEQSDIIAIILSVFIPGLGHILLGQKSKGILFLALMIFTCYGFGLLWIVAAVDSFLVARARKYRALGDWEFFPDYKQAFNL
jgi:TM2 domain-containing membrane protein YozV